MNTTAQENITATESRNIFRKSNLWILTYIAFNIIFIWAFLSGFSWNANALLRSLILYSISLGIALSPIGEWMLRLQTGCKKIKRKDHLEIINPIFEEAYVAAKTVTPNLPNNIKLYINPSNIPNAFAAGRKTVCITRGLLKMPKEQIRAILGHEFGHIAHRDTYLLQAVIIGNFFVTAIVFIIKAFVWVATTIGQIDGFANSSSVGGYLQFILSSFAKILSLVGISVFMWLWTRLGMLMIRKSSRENEFEADRFSASCGYKTDLIAAFETLADLSDDDSEPKGLFRQLCATHPDFDSRIAYLQDMSIPSLA